MIKLQGRMAALNAHSSSFLSIYVHTCMYVYIYIYIYIYIQQTKSRGAHISPQRLIFIPFICVCVYTCVQTHAHTHMNSGPSLKERMAALNAHSSSSQSPSGTTNTATPSANTHSWSHPQHNTNHPASFLSPSGNQNSPASAYSSANGSVGSGKTFNSPTSNAQASPPNHSLGPPQGNNLSSPTSNRHVGSPTAVSSPVTQHVYNSPASSYGSPPQNHGLQAHSHSGASNPYASPHHAKTNSNPGTYPNSPTDGATSVYNPSANFYTGDGGSQSQSQSQGAYSAQPSEPKAVASEGIRARWPALQESQTAQVCFVCFVPLFACTILDATYTLRTTHFGLLFVPIFRAKEKVVQMCIEKKSSKPLHLCVTDGRSLWKPTCMQCPHMYS
jgi:hypothetical protein